MTGYHFDAAQKLKACGERRECDEDAIVCMQEALYMYAAPSKRAQNSHAIDAGVHHRLNIHTVYLVLSSVLAKSKGQQSLSACKRRSYIPTAGQNS